MECYLVGSKLRRRIAYGQAGSPSAAQLEALEHFAGKPTAHVTWSKDVSHIDTDLANAVITALVVEDETQTPRQMRGLRIDLSSAAAQDQVYTSEDLIARLIKALDEISTGLPRFLSDRSRRSGL